MFRETHFSNSTRNMKKQTVITLFMKTYLSHLDRLDGALDQVCGLFAPVTFHHVTFY